MDVQFRYNSDFPALSPRPPLDFPPAQPIPCARITAKVFHPSRNEVSNVQNVLVRTMLPTRSSPRTATASAMDDDDVYSSSSSSSSDDESDDEMMETEGAAPGRGGEGGGGGDERAYWMQRTIREAIYGRVCVGIVLTKRSSDTWEVTGEKCAIKEMSWQHIRKERDRLAEDPIKEVSAMEYLRRWHDQSKKQPLSATSANSLADSLILQQASSPGLTRQSSISTSFEAMAETNIMMPMDLLSDDRYLYSVMPFCDGGELFERLDMNEKFTEEEARYWMLQVLNVSVSLYPFS